MTREDQEEAAYFAGFKHGSEHADEDFDRAPGARDLGLYPGDFGLRDEWNHGRQDGACAVRLGHDAKGMLENKLRGPGLIDPAYKIVELLTERDHARAELASLRDLVRETLLVLSSRGGGRACGGCYALATKDVPSVYGSVYECDSCFRPERFTVDVDDDGRRPTDTMAAALIRKLAEAIKETP